MTKTILAIDTATEACSVALSYKGEITHLAELSPRTHTQRILPMVDELLSQSGVSLKQLDALAFGRGPGSFTGVRVGVAVAQGLALGANLPVIAISNLTAMAQAAYQQYQTDNVIALIDARMNEVYYSQLTRNRQGEWQAIVAEQVCSAEKAIMQIQPAENSYIVGTGWAAYPQFEQALVKGQFIATISDIILPSAQYMLPLAEYELSQNNVKSALEIEPVYLRNEVTWQKLPHKM